MARSIGTGALIADRYRLGESLGHGGMSRVFRAVDEALGREVAIKLLREPLVEHTDRFEREARTMGRLKHPAVVKVYGYGLTPGEEDGTKLPYLVLELVDDATSLAQFVEARGPLGVTEAVRLMRPIAGALAEAHAHGIVHRDLKPENILIQYAAGLDPLLRLIDFGIAAWDEPTAQRLTQTGQIFGTPAYMAPEHATGEFGAGPTADVWAIGVILHEMVSGECPFRGPHVTATLFNLTTKPAPRLDGVSAGFQAVVDDCLQKSTDDRLPDASAVLDRLTALTAGEETAPPETARDIATDPTLGFDPSSASGDVSGPPSGPLVDPLDAEEVLPVRKMDGAARAERQAQPTMALTGHPPRRTWPMALASGVLGLLIGLGAGTLGGHDSEAPTAPIAEPAALAAGATSTATPTLVDAMVPDAGPPPLVDPGLGPAEGFLAAGDSDRATEWLEANPDAGSADARIRLTGLIELEDGAIRAGIEHLDDLLTRRPDLAADATVRSALVGVLDKRAAGEAVDILAIMIGAAPELEAELIELTDNDDYRTRKRAYRIIRRAGFDGDAAALRFHVRNLRLVDCDLRRHAVEQLQVLGDPKAIAPIKAMDERTGFFDSLCMDDAVDRTLATLRAARNRRARAAAAAARDARPTDAGPTDASAEP